MAPPPHDVSPGNPCPFLRALVTQGLLPDGAVPLSTVSQTLGRVAAAGDGSPALPGAAVRAIALVANGLGPGSLLRNTLGGVRLDRLRGGPLDKRGAGSRILDERAHVVTRELERLATFASPKTDAEGRTEPGLDAAELKAMMDANFERAAGRRRAIDRRLMDGEWPVLLKVMGKEGRSGRYLSVAEVSSLFRERRLPGRMLARLKP